MVRPGIVRSIPDRCMMACQLYHGAEAGRVVQVHGKQVVVIGGGGGLGEAIVGGLADAGAVVYALDLPQALQRIDGSGIRGIAVDVSEEEDVVRALGQVE